MTATPDDRDVPRQWTDADIDRMLAETDFEAIRAAMVAVGWTYGDEIESPTAEHLRETARGLLASSLETGEPESSRTRARPAAATLPSGATRRSWSSRCSRRRSTKRGTAMPSDHRDVVQRLRAEGGEVNSATRARLGTWARVSSAFTSGSRTPSAPLR